MRVPVFFEELGVWVAVAVGVEPDVAEALAVGDLQAGGLLWLGGVGVGVGGGVDGSAGGGWCGGHFDADEVGNFGGLKKI